MIDSKTKRTPPRPLSITHRHLLSCINTTLSGSNRKPGPIRILDVGCGDGLLIEYLFTSLSQNYPDRNIEVHGMDVNDHGVQPQGFWANTVRRLSAAIPFIDWQQRLHLVSSTDPWPYPDGHFELVVSNQVLEHVDSHKHFFGQHQRVMSDGGVGFHLFPLRHCIVEPHIRLPFVHRIADHEWRKSAIALGSKLGLGKFSGPSANIDSYATVHANYLTIHVNYKTQSEISAAAAASGLAPSFALTHWYFAQKILSVMGREFIESYPNGNWIGVPSAILLRYLPSSALELRSKIKP